MSRNQEVHSILAGQRHLYHSWHLSWEQAESAKCHRILTARRMTAFWLALISFMAGPQPTVQVNLLRIWTKIHPHRALPCIISTSCFLKTQGTLSIRINFSALSNSDYFCGGRLFIGSEYLWNKIRPICCALDKKSARPVPNDAGRRLVVGSRSEAGLGRQSSRLPGEIFSTVI